MPKITKLKLDNNYVFVHKYCNNCYYLNNNIYKKIETPIVPTGTIYV
jgi:hypothetical protein